jgi:tetratricopeptide (TPR) repeat protein
VSLQEAALPDVRRFATADPDQYRPILAAWLITLASRSVEASEIHRRLATSDPACIDELWSSLSLAATSLYVLSREEEAVTAWSEALEMLQRQGEDPTRPAKIASGLHNMALALSGLHRHAQAIEALSESIRHRRGLLEADDTTEPAKRLGVCAAPAVIRPARDTAV